MYKPLYNSNKEPAVFPAMPARMEDYSNLAGFPSPSNSQYYRYGDAEQHLDSHTSESQSPVNSPVSAFPAVLEASGIVQSNRFHQYDMAYIPDFSNIGFYPSPEREEEEEESSPNGKKPAAKRKRENRYKNAPPAVLSRRRAQNRASQRAYRERKDQRIKDLETMLNEAKQRNDHLSHAYAALHDEYVQLKTSQLKEQQQQQQQQQAQQQQAQVHHHAAIYGHAGELVFDPTMVGMATNNERLDMGLYVYTDMDAGMHAIPM